LNIIREVYCAHERRPPNNFEIIAGLAAIRGIKDSAQIEDAIVSHIDFHEGMGEPKGKPSLKCLSHVRL
jgi:hypothetical protein